MILDIDAIEQKIGYVFKDKMLLRKCFTHSSYANEHKIEDNEVLEFYGDAIIGFIVTEYLCANISGSEGDLTKRRADIVSKEPLLRAVAELGLNEYVLLGKGQSKSHTNNEKFYSSIYEALCAGIYLDGGMAPVKRFVKNTIIKDYVEGIKKHKKTKSQVKPTTVSEKDPKSELQEYVQKKKIGSISYELLDKSGPDNRPSFRMGLLLNNSLIAEGQGGSKREAEKRSAKIALQLLKEQEGKRN